jgi:hypothetical protein
MKRHNRIINHQISTSCKVLTVSNMQDRRKIQTEFWLDHWRAVVKTAINVWVSKNVENFFTN